MVYSIPLPTLLLVRGIGPTLVETCLGWTGGGNYYSGFLLTRQVGVGKLGGGDLGYSWVMVQKFFNRSPITLKIGGPKNRERESRKRERESERERALVELVVIFACKLLLFFTRKLLFYTCKLVFYTCKLWFYAYKLLFLRVGCCFIRIICYFTRVSFKTYPSKLQFYFSYLQFYASKNVGGCIIKVIIDINFFTCKFFYFTLVSCYSTPVNCCSVL
jgi:hypothetical protein